MKPYIVVNEVEVFQMHFQVQEREKGFGVSCLPQFSMKALVASVFLWSIGVGKDLLKMVFCQVGKRCMPIACLIKRYMLPLAMRWALKSGY